LNNRGKEKAALEIAQAVTTILQEQRNEPISLHWKNDLEDMKSQALREDRTKIKNIKTTVLDKELATPNVATHGESAEDIKEISDKRTQSGIPENLEHPTTKEVRSSKRLKKHQ
jgi:hypothetical protein